MQLVKQGFKYISAFVVVTFLLTYMLVLAAMIPRSVIKDNVRESAIYLCDGELFGMALENVPSSKIDRYADSILLAIAYQYDNDKPLDSVMWSSYYHYDLENENVNLLAAVENDYAANQQYLRYWHGSNVLVRPLLAIFNLKQIYILNGIVLALLAACLLIMLARQKAYTLVIGVIAGLFATSVWFVPLSLEYTWTYLLMLIASIIAVKLAVKRRYKMFGIFFLISGIVTNYMDFLTTETLTLTIPLLLVMWIDERINGQQDTRKLIHLSVKTVLAWGIGYVGMWITKWLVASAVLSQNVMPYVTEHIGERLGGEIGLNPIQYIFGAIWKNISCIFPFEYGMIGRFISISLVIYMIYAGYVYHGNKLEKNKVLLYVLIGSIPYIRYMVLHNHSYLHHFFTYRAQLATILAIVIILEHVTDGMRIVRGNKKKSNG